MKVKCLLLFVLVICLLVGGSLVEAHSVNHGEDDGVVRCHEPKPKYVALCQERAEQLLQSTVRLEVLVWHVKPDESGYELQYSISHATLKAGRYLVTHNHFGLPLASPCEAAECSDYITISLYDSVGKPLLVAPVGDFAVMVKDAETLVLEIRRAQHQETLRTHHIASASYDSLTSLELQPGMEVAQIDWDGTTTRLNWTVIQEIVLDKGTPRFILADGVNRGASGGGVFRNGHHIGNTWSVRENINELTGVVMFQTSTAALNSDKVVR